jgi:hypothetical protein
VLRSIRADFAPEIWHGLGQAREPGLFTRSEFWVMLGVVAINGLSILILDNRRAFFVSLGTSLAGLLLVGLALIGLKSGRLEGFSFMVLVGLGLYIPYVAIHTTIFERLIAMTRDRGNIGYLMYLADAFGYLGYVAVMLGRNLFSVQGSFLDYFVMASWVTFALCSGLLLLSFQAFWVSTARPREDRPVSIEPQGKSREAASK